MVYQKLLISFINRKNIPWNLCIHMMKQNCIILSKQLIHIWHGVIQNIGMVLNTHHISEWVGGGAFGKIIKSNTVYNCFLLLH